MMATPRPLDQLPLPVRIFHTAMQRQKPLDAYAAGLDIPAEALRALLTAQTDGLDPEALNRLAVAHGLSAEAGLASLSEVAAAESFSAWLNRHMEGISQTSLRARTQLDGPQLRAFLNGKTLPDADQAERIARALYVNSVEMARIIVADMASRTARPARSPGRSPEAAVAAGAAERAPAEPVAPRPRRRQPTVEAADGQPAVAAPATSEAAPEPSASGEPAAVEPTPGRRRRAATPVPAAPAAEGSPQPAGPPAEEVAAAVDQDSTAQVELAEPAAVRRRRAPARAPAAPAAEEAPGPASAPADASATAVAQAPPLGASREPSAEDQAQPAPARRRGRQPAAAVEPPAASLVAAENEPPPAAPPEARAAARPSRSRAAAPRLAETASAPPSAAPATSEATSTQQPAAQAPRDAEAPTTAAVVRPGEATLQLSPDEVRLIRSWRRLHPHGQRATLQYIGSLLIEE
jgi:hypothetical protein